MGDALHTGGTTADGQGVTSAREARLAQAGLLAVQGPTVLDVRTGVLHGPGSTALVTGNGDTAPMSYSVAPHQWVTSRRTADGPYLGALDVVRKAATTPAPVSGARIDVIYVRQADNATDVLTPDAVTEDQYGVTQGVSFPGTPQKPQIPVGALELATATVAAGATATNGAGVTITNTARQTVPRGAPIPVRSQAERDALDKYDSLTVRRLDLPGRPTETWDGTWNPTHGGDTGWVAVPTKTGFGSNQGGLQVRCIGKQVQCRYGWSAAGLSLGGASTVATVPEGFRPPGSFYGWAGTANPNYNCRIVVDGATGDVSLTPGGTTVSSYFRMDNCSWLID